MTTILLGLSEMSNAILVRLCFKNILSPIWHFYIVVQVEICLTYELYKVQGFLVDLASHGVPEDI